MEEELCIALLLFQTKLSSVAFENVVIALPPTNRTTAVYSLTEVPLWEHIPFRYDQSLVDKPQVTAVPCHYSFSRPSTFRITSCRGPYETDLIRFLLLYETRESNSTQPQTLLLFLCPWIIGFLLTNLHLSYFFAHVDRLPVILYGGSLFRLSGLPRIKKPTVTLVPSADEARGLG